MTIKRELCHFNFSSVPVSSTTTEEFHHVMVAIDSRESLIYREDVTDLLEQIGDT